MKKQDRYKKIMEYFYNRGFSDEEIAGYLGTAKSTAYGWRVKGTRPHPEHRKKLDKFFDLIQHIDSYFAASEILQKASGETPDMRPLNQGETITATNDLGSVSMMKVGAGSLRDGDIIYLDTRTIEALKTLENVSAFWLVKNIQFKGNDHA